MNADSFSLINLRLGKLIKQTEGAYTSLGTLFPRIVAEMEKSTAESRSRAECFGVNVCSDDLSIEREALRLVDETRSFIKKSGDFFSGVKKGDEELIVALKQDLERIGTLDSVILKVREDSEEMELISLNAMTVALKSGLAGRGFSVITEELKRLSSSTIILTDSMTEYGKKLMDLYREFRDEIALLAETQEQLFSKTDTLIHENFDNLDSSIKSIAAFFSGLAADSQTVSGPIMGIMQEIQLQDIIRQSIEHVILSLEEIGRGKERIEHADELIFMKIMTELARSLLLDVREKIHASVTGLVRRIDDVNGIISVVEEKRMNWLSSHRTSADDRLGKKQHVRGLCEELVAYGRERSRVSHSGDRVSATVRELDRRFKKFNDILGRFHTIVIASRIEVAKSSLLASMTDTVGQMMVLTDRIENDVSVAVEQTKSFIKNSAEFILRYSERTVDEEPLVRKSAEIIEERFATLFAVETNVETNVGEFILYTQEFKDLISRSREDVSALEVLMNEVDDINVLLESFHSHAERELRGRDAEISGIHNERLREIIQRFTIFTHKKAAGDLAGFAVETGADSGEITFF